MEFSSSSLFDETSAADTPGNTTAPIPLFNFDLPLPPRPDNPAPRGLRFPGNPDPRPYVTDKEKSAFCKSPKKF